MKKKYFVPIFIGFLIFSTMGCGTKETTVQKQRGVTDNEIKIGSSLALGGHASFLGTQYLHGALAYINEVNEKGGVYGRRVNIISYDDQYDPPKTIANTQKLINEDEVFALFNYVGTPTSVRIIDIVHQAEIPTLGFFTGAEALRSPHRPYMFHVRDSYYAEAEGAINYFVNKLGFKKIAVMYQEDAFGLAVLAGVQLALDSRNLETVVTATYKRGTMDVEDALNTIKVKDVQAVVMVGTYSPLAKYINLSHDAGFYPYFHTVSFVGSEAFAKEIVDVQKVDPGQYDKIIVTQVVPSPASRAFSGIQEYLGLFKKYYPNDKPNYVALEGFINAKVLVKALEDAGRGLTREKFIDALESVNNFNVGIGKNITYNVLDHKGLEGIYYSKITPSGVFEIFNP